MNELMNYDMNLCYSGKMAKQKVRLTFAQWRYRKTVEVEVGGNCLGLTVIDCAVGKVYDELDSLDAIYGDNVAVIHLPCGDDELECSDDEGHGEDWLKSMLIAAEIVSIEPAK